MASNTSSSPQVASLDTSIILRLLLNDRPGLRAEITALLTSGPTFYVDDFVIGEAVHVLEREGFARTDIADLLLGLLQNSLFDCHFNALTAIFAFYVSRPKLSYNDCYLAHQACTRPATPLYTLDHKLALQAPAAVELSQAS